MGGMADMLRGMGMGGGGGGAGGMPDLASLMSNPMMMNMAQQMMANGGLQGLMQNPAVANMVNPLSNLLRGQQVECYLKDGACSEWRSNAIDG